MQCGNCQTENPDSNRFCFNCGIALNPAAMPAPSQPRNIAPERVTVENLAPVRVAISDFNMPFIAIVGFMVKLALASIPAALILFLLYGVLFAGLGFLAILARR